MASEVVKTISEARQTLPKLSETAQRQMERYLITNQGKPQSVVIGYDDYRQMSASFEFIQRPDELQKIAEGLQQVREGKTMTFAELKTARAAKAKRPGAKRQAARPLVEAAV
jgi:prevent-host-death family protein